MSKLVKTCIELAAFVALAVVPASAIAVNDPLITHPTGTKLSVSHESPAIITGTFTAPGKFTDAEGNTLLSCETGHLHGDLETNTGTGPGTGTVEGTITSAAFNNVGSEHCTGALTGKTTVTTKFGAGEGNGVPWCVRSTTTMVTDELQIRGGACTESPRSITFALHTTNIGTCFYNRTAAISGAYATHPLDLTIHIAAVEFNKEPEVSGIFCPSKAFVYMTITFETTNGTPLYAQNQ